MLSYFIAMITLIVPISLYGTTGKSIKEDRVRAQIGIQIQSEKKIFRAKSRERLKRGDLIRLYVYSEKKCYIYVVHTDTKSVNLLHITEQPSSSTLILPSAQAYYEIDGNSSTERFTIICTPKKLSKRFITEDQSINYKYWRSMETELMKKSKILVTDEEREFTTGMAGSVASIEEDKKYEIWIAMESELSKQGKPLPPDETFQPFAISAGVQGKGSGSTDPFLKELQICSGKGLLVKIYIFKIKKEAPSRNQ